MIQRYFVRIHFKTFTISKVLSVHYLGYTVRLSNPGHRYTGRIPQNSGTCRGRTGFVHTH